MNYVNFIILFIIAIGNGIYERILFKYFTYYVKVYNNAPFPIYQNIQSNKKISKCVGIISVFLQIIAQ